MNTKVKVTEKLFNAVKTLLAGGATANEIHDYLNVGHSTVTRIKNSDTYEDYRQQMTAIACEIKARRNATKQPVKPDVTEQPVKPDAKDWYVTNRALKALEEQNELLKLISNKLAFIVEQLA